MGDCGVVPAVRNAESLPAPAEMETGFHRVADRPLAHMLVQVHQLQASLWRWLKVWDGAQGYDGRDLPHHRKGSVPKGAILDLRRARREERQVRARGANGADARRAPGKSKTMDFSYDGVAADSADLRGDLRRAEPVSPIEL
jgi:hypothetical protein